MKFLPYLIFFLSLSLYATAQVTAFRLPSREMELGTYVPTATAITGTQYTLPAEVHSYFYDSAANEIIILLKKDKEFNIGAVGELLVFDMKMNSVKWSKGINTFNIYVTGKYIITSNGGSAKCYHRSNGKQAWKKTDANIKYIDEQKGIVLTDYIRALDINNGKILWQKYLPVKYNWEDVHPSGENSVLIASGGLYNIDLATGKGWNTNDITNKEEFTVPTAMGLIAETPQFVRSNAIANDTRRDLRRGTTSGILADGSTVYFATRARLLSLDKESGKLNWQTPLPKEKTTISTLYATESSVVLVNHAKVTNQLGLTKKYGNAYIASFAKENGAQNYIMEPANDNYVTDVMVRNSKIMLLMNEAIYAYDMLKGDEIHSAGKTPTNYGFVRSVYTFSGEENSDEMVDSKCCYIHRANDQVFFFGLGDKTSYDLTTKDIAASERYKKGLLLYNGKNSLLQNNQVVVSTPAMNAGFVAGNKLYILQGQALSVLPLEQPK